MAVDKERCFLLDYILASPGAPADVVLKFSHVQDLTALRQTCKTAVSFVSSSIEEWGVLDVDDDIPIIQTRLASFRKSFPQIRSARLHLRLGATDSELLQGLRKLSIISPKGKKPVPISAFEAVPHLTELLLENVTVDETSFAGLAKLRILSITKVAGITDASLQPLGGSLQVLHINRCDNLSENCLAAFGVASEVGAAQDDHGPLEPAQYTPRPGRGTSSSRGLKELHWTYTGELRLRSGFASVCPSLERLSLHGGMRFHGVRVRELPCLTALALHTQDYGMVRGSYDRVVYEDEELLELFGSGPCSLRSLSISWSLSPALARHVVAIMPHLTCLALGSTGFTRRLGREIYVEPVLFTSPRLEEVTLQALCLYKDYCSVLQELLRPSGPRIRKLTLKDCYGTFLPFFQISQVPRGSTALQALEELHVSWTPSYNENDLTDFMSEVQHAEQVVLSLLEHLGKRRTLVAGGHVHGRAGHAPALDPWGLYPGGQLRLIDIRGVHGKGAGTLLLPAFLKAAVKCQDVGTFHRAYPGWHLFAYSGGDCFMLRYVG